MPLTLVYAEHHRLDVAHRAVERLGQEAAVARRVQHARHADHPLARKAARLHGDVAHHVERVADDDEDRLRRRLRDLLCHRPDDAGVGVQQVVARHAGLAGDAGRDDDDVRILRLLIAIRADGRTLPLIEPLALRNPLGDIDHDDGARELLLRHALGSRRPDIAGADDGDLVDHESGVV
jgi:hypothetical protein